MIDLILFALAAIGGVFGLFQHQSAKRHKKEAETAKKNTATLEQVIKVKESMGEANIESDEIYKATVEKAHEKDSDGDLTKSSY